MGMREANALHRAGRSVDAQQLIRRHLRSNPDDHSAVHLLGTIAHDRGDLVEAIRQMRESIRLAPTNPAYCVNLAAVLGRLGKHEEAMSYLLQAMKRSGKIPELHCNLGATLEALERIPEAVNAYRTAIELRPSYPEAHFNLGNALRKTGRFQAATQEYMHALRLRANYWKVFDGLGACALELGDIDQLVACQRKVVQHEQGNAGAWSSLLYTLHYHPDMDAQALSREHREWGRTFCKATARGLQPYGNDRSPDRRIRLGYISPDFREHTVPHFVTAALEHHNPRQFEVFCYSDVERPDEITAYLQTRIEHWKHVRGQTDDVVERMIREDRIDILVDLRGHAGANRLPLFCRKPAPIQVNMVGYFDTTGLDTIDYRVTDDLQDPPGETDALHTERLIRIQGGCWCYTPSTYAPPVGEAPVLNNGYVVFGSLNKIIKVSRPCGELWARVLNAVPGSKLLLSMTGPESAAVVRRRLGEWGIAPHRLVIVDKTQTGREYLSRFNEVDIALDTFPFNGITTTCDGLWMGVPLVTLGGRTTVSRSGTSILHSANLAEFAANDPDSFVRIAVELAADHAKLGQLRASMRERLLAAPLMDHRAFAEKLESAFRAAWREWCAGDPPMPHIDSAVDTGPASAGAGGPSPFGDQPIHAETDPTRDLVNSLFESAIEHYNAGRLQEAEAKYREVLAHDPHHARALHMAGFVAYRTGRHDVAIELIRSAIEADPAEPEYLNNLGVVLAAGKRIEEAIAAYRQALVLRPDYAEAHSNLGAALQLQGSTTEAIESHRRALSLRPDYAEAHANLAVALEAQGSYREATAALETVLALEPKHARAWVSLGQIALASGKPERAIVNYRQALLANPKNAEARQNIGYALQAMGRIDESIQAYAEALVIRPESAEARFALSLAQLLKGNFIDGWQNYESRWAANQVTIPESFSSRQWDGSDLNGRRILLQAEQGLGDTLQFVRYAPLVAARGGKVILQCRPELVRLLERQCGIAEIFSGSKNIPDFDVYCSLMTLPRIFGTTPQTVPAERAYLKADPGAAELWGTRFAREATGLKVGIAWAGDSGHRRDHERSIPLREFASLGAISGIQFYSLQKGDAAQECNSNELGPLRVTDWTHSLTDFADTAAMVSCLDLVISVDTAVAHLAAALGKTTWILIPSAPDWRWLTGRDDSPWYPTARLFRQPKVRDWETPIHQITEAIGDAVEARGPAAEVEATSCFGRLAPPF